MKREGLSAIIYGATGSTGAVSTSLRRISFKFYLNHQNGQGYMQLSVNNFLNGAKSKEKKNYPQKNIKIWITISNRQIINITDMIVSFLALELRLRLENNSLEKLIKHIPYWLLISRSKIVLLTLSRNSTLSFSQLQWLKC